MQNLCLQITKSQGLEMEMCLLATSEAPLPGVRAQCLISHLGDSQLHFLGIPQQWWRQQHLRGCMWPSRSHTEP